MWLTETKIGAFWTEKKQIGLDLDASKGLTFEDIVSPMDLAEFKKE